MESLSLFLQDYKELVGGLASIVTIGQFLAGGFICKDIYKKGSTDGISGMPFIGGVVIGFLMLQYSLMLNDPAMLTVNVAAIGLNVLYLLFYFFYSNTKGDVIRSLGIGAVMVAVLVGYTKVENQELVEYRFGLIVTVLMFGLIASPLFEVKDIIKKKDASCIPFPIVLCGTVVSFLWLLYGIILLNEFMVFQNIVGLILCAIQLVLCYMYPESSKIKKKAE